MNERMSLRRWWSRYLVSIVSLCFLALAWRGILSDALRRCAGIYSVSRHPSWDQKLSAITVEAITTAPAVLLISSAWFFVLWFKNYPVRFLLPAIFMLTVGTTIATTIEHDCLETWRRSGAVETAPCYLGSTIITLFASWTLGMILHEYLARRYGRLQSRSNDQLSQRRMRFWLSSRIAMVVIVVFALFVLLAWYFRSGNDRQQAIVTQLQSRGAQVWYGGFCHDDMTFDPNPHVPPWLRSLVPNRHVVYVEFTGTGATDSDVAPVAELHHVRQLGLSYTKITDRTLSNIADMNELEFLHIEQCTLSEQAIKKLRDEMPWLDVMQ